jgi:hypothetical protein
VSDQPIFRLRLRPLKDVDPIRALRHVLKRLLRTYGMKCISVEEEKDDETIFNPGHPLR